MINNKVGIKYGLLLSCLLTFASCAPSTVYLTQQPRLLHFATPETSGGWGKGDVSISFSGKEPAYEFGSLNPYGSFNANILTVSQEKILQDGGVSSNLFLNIGLLEKIDVYMTFNEGAGIKYQVIGSPRETLEEGLKLALSIQFINLESDNKGGDDLITSVFSNLLGDSTELAFSKSKTTGTDISSNIGYRYNPNSLVYINTFLNRSDFSGELWLDNSAIYHSTSATSKTFGLLLGYQYTTDSGGFFTFETGVAKTSWNNRGSVFATPVGFSWGHSW